MSNKIKQQNSLLSTTGQDLNADKKKLRTQIQELKAKEKEKKSVYIKEINAYIYINKDKDPATARENYLRVIKYGKR